MAAMYFLTGLLQLLAFATADETGKQMDRKERWMNKTHEKTLFKLKFFAQK